MFPSLGCQLSPNQFEAPQNWDPGKVSAGAWSICKSLQSIISHSIVQALITHLDKHSNLRQGWRQRDQVCNKEWPSVTWFLLTPHSPPANLRVENRHLPDHNNCFQTTEHLHKLSPRVPSPLDKHLLSTHFSTLNITRQVNLQVNCSPSRASLLSL